MKQEARVLLASAISVAFFWIWSVNFQPKKPVNDAAPTPVESTSAVAAVNASATSNSSQAGAATSNANGANGGGASSSSSTTNAANAAQISVNDPQANLPIQIHTLDNGRVRVTLTNDGAVPTEWKVRGYQQNERADLPPIDLASASTLPPLTLDFSGLAPDVPARPRFAVTSFSEHAPKKIEWTWRGHTVEIVKTFTLEPDTYQGSLTVHVRNLTNAALQGVIAVPWSAQNPPAPPKQWWSFTQRAADNWHPVIARPAGVQNYADLSKLKDPLREEGKFLWGGIENRYFLAAILPQELSPQMHMTASAQPQSDGGLQSELALVSAPLAIPAQGDTTLSYKLFGGPKEIHVLQRAGSTLNGAIDYGWLSWLALPILWLLQQFYSIVHNYGIAIILLTVLIKLLLHPVNKASLQSMKKMQALQPQLKALQEKFKDNKEKLNQEMMQLFRTNKVNPMAGCLPMLAQIPIYFALYRVLWNAVELYRAPFVGFYRDLSAPDPYLIMPVLLAFAFVAQQKLTPSPSSDPSQKKMMMGMTLMFSVFMVSLPMGLVLYILVNTGMSIAQQWMLHRNISLRQLVGLKG